MLLTRPLAAQVCRWPSGAHETGPGSEPGIGRPRSDLRSEKAGHSPGSGVRLVNFGRSRASVECDPHHSVAGQNKLSPRQKVEKLIQLRVIICEDWGGQLLHGSTRVPGNESLGDQWFIIRTTDSSRRWVCWQNVKTKIIWPNLKLVNVVDLLIRWYWLNKSHSDKDWATRAQRRYIIDWAHRHSSLLWVASVFGLKDLLVKRN